MICIMDSAPWLNMWTLAISTILCMYFTWDAVCLCPSLPPPGQSWLKSGRQRRERSNSQHLGTKTAGWSTKAIDSEGYRCYKQPINKRRADQPQNFEQICWSTLDEQPTTNGWPWYTTYQSREIPWDNQPSMGIPPQPTQLGMSLVPGPGHF